jgi:DNA ligase-1
LQRREILSQVLSNLPGSRLILSPVVQAQTWEDLKIQREESRHRGVEGFMLKRLDSVYQVGRRRGDWWKWKIDPLTVDAVLIYAQRGRADAATGGNGKSIL